MDRLFNTVRFVIKLSDLIIWELIESSIFSTSRSME